jgi:hypothetical protein
MEKYKIELKWALIFFVVSLIWIFLEKLVGLHDAHIDKHPIYTNFFAIIAIAVYVFALLDKRNNFYHGKMNWMQGFVSGVIISVIVAVLSPLAQYLTHEVITPEYFPNAIEYAVSSGKMERAAAEASFSLNNYLIQSAIGAIGMGVLTSAIVAVFVKKK